MLLLELRLLRLNKQTLISTSGIWMIGEKIRLKKRKGVDRENEKWTYLEEIKKYNFESTIQRFYD